MQKDLSALEKQLKDYCGNHLISSYTFSVGEIVSLFKQGNLVAPTQRSDVAFWNIEDKSTFIEGLFLGLPQQPFFVLQDEQYIIYDGLQRLYCILDFMQLAEDEQGFALELPNTKHCPELNGLHWSDICNDDYIETYLVQKITRVGLQFYILKKTNDDSEGFATEISERLNKGIFR